MLTAVNRGRIRLCVLAMIDHLAVLPRVALLAAAASIHTRAVVRGAAVNRGCIRLRVLAMIDDLAVLPSVALLAAAASIHTRAVVRGAAVAAVDDLAVPSRVAALTLTPPEDTNPMRATTHRVDRRPVIAEVCEVVGPAASRHERAGMVLEAAMQQVFQTRTRKPSGHVQEEEGVADSPGRAAGHAAGAVLGLGHLAPPAVLDDLALLCGEAAAFAVAAAVVPRLAARAHCRDQ